jgi:hypothetical protein
LAPLGRGASGFAWLLGGLLAVACGSSSSRSSSGFQPSPAKGEPGSGNPSDTTDNYFGTVTDDPKAPSSDGCSEEAKLVYVLSSDNVLYSFSPASKKFTRIANLECAAADRMVVNSMAIDRKAIAWVNYVQTGLTDDTGGILAAVDTKTGRCTGQTIRLPKKWYRLGMGFSTNGADTAAETLYVASSTPSVGLGEVDFTTGKVLAKGAFKGITQSVSTELTGTGDGRLYGFFASDPVILAELEKDTGGLLQPKRLPTVEVPFGFAFSFWGGRFYLYTAPGDDLLSSRTSTVAEFDPATGQVDPAYMTEIGFKILGAGVSTCAPLAQPR